MNRTTTLALYTGTITYDAENNPVSTWTTAKSVTGNIMPRSLTSAELAQYGIDTRTSGVMAFYFDGDSAVVVGTRLGAYNVRAVNVWPKHTEAILEPV